jgi:hypothetical protein
MKAKKLSAAGAAQKPLVNQYLALHGWGGHGARPPREPMLPVPVHFKSLAPVDLGLAPLREVSAPLCGKKDLARIAPFRSMVPHRALLKKIICMNQTRKRPGGPHLPGGLGEKCTSTRARIPR